MSLSTKNLLVPQARVFTSKRRNYGATSVLLAAVSVALVLPVYSAFVGLLLPMAWLMVTIGFAASMVGPWLLIRRLRPRGLSSNGPGLFAGVNVLMAFVFFVGIGGSTDRALESQGLTPFVALADWAGAEDGESHALTSAGETMVGVLRALTVTKDGRGTSDEDVAPTQISDTQVDEPRVSADRAGAFDVSADQPNAVQAYKGSVPRAESLGPAASSLAAGSMVEVPIARNTGVFVVGAVVDGRPADFVFDTGADLTAITPALARRLGFDPEGPGEKRTFLTAGGPVIDKVIRLQRVSVDGAEVRDVEAVICRLCPNNLLGRNFHGAFRVEIDSGAGILRLFAR